MSTEHPYPKPPPSKGEGSDYTETNVNARFPSRRAFLSLLADPAYGPVEPYKKMALELVLVPVSGEVVLPAIPKVPLPGREALKHKRQEDQEVKQ